MLLDGAAIFSNDDGVNTDGLADAGVGCDVLLDSGEDVALADGPLYNDASPGTDSALLFPPDFAESFFRSAHPQSSESRTQISTSLWNTQVPLTAGVATHAAVLWRLWSTTQEVLDIVYLLCGRAG